MTTCCGLPCAWAVADRPTAVTNKADRGMTAFHIASRDEVRHSVSGVRARRVRHARIERPRADAGARRLRLVRYPGVDRRGSAPHVFQDVDAGVADFARRRIWRSFDDRVDFVSAVLGT